MSFPQTTRRYADAFYNYQFTFDKIFSSEDKNEDFYLNCKQLLQYTLQGCNSCLFLYGQTTSGKIYTMLGDQENSGLLPYTLLDLFKECQLPIAISYIEIYNEQINDLLQQGVTNLKMQDINGLHLDFLPKETIESLVGYLLNYIMAILNEHQLQLQLQINFIFFLFKGYYKDQAD